MARPTKLTPEVHDKIVTAIRAGNYIETASAYAGISKPSLYAWLKRGAAEASGPYHDFSAAVEKALAEAEMRDVDVITQAAAANWQAAAWRLERKFPDRWGRRMVTLEHSGKVEVSHKMNLSKLTDEELEQLDRLLGKSANEGGDPGREGPA